MLKHLLGECLSGGLDSEVPKHGIRLPTSKELDVIGVNASAEEGGGAAWSKGASAEELGRDAGEGLEKLS